MQPLIDWLAQTSLSLAIQTHEWVVPTVQSIHIVAIGIVMAILPSVGELSANVHLYGHHATETPLPLTDAKGDIVYPGFPADVLFSFRFTSICDQVVLWGTLGLAFGPMAERVLRPVMQRSETAGGAGVTAAAV